MLCSEWKTRERPGRDQSVCVCVCVCVCVQLLWVSGVCVCVCVCVCVYKLLWVSLEILVGRSVGPLPGTFQATLPKLLEVLLSVLTTFPGPSYPSICAGRLSSSCPCSDHLASWAVSCVWSSHLHWACVVSAVAPSEIDEIHSTVVSSEVVDGDAKWMG